MADLVPGRKYPAEWHRFDDVASASPIPGLFWIDQDDGNVRAAMHRDFEPNNGLRFLAAGPYSYGHICGQVMSKFVTLINCTIASASGI